MQLLWASPIPFLFPMAKPSRMRATLRSLHPQVSSKWPSKWPKSIW